jgi:hypothetical protein
MPVRKHFACRRQEKSLSPRQTKSFCGSNVIHKNSTLQIHRETMWKFSRAAQIASAPVSEPALHRGANRQ